MSSESVGRKLTELRVCDLKDELQKRELDATGLKNDLVERLQKALKEEGKDHESYLFPSLDKRTKSTPVKKSDEDAEADENGVDNGKEDDEDYVETSNANDNDESLNLTIGEDEQKLLHDEAQDEKDKKKNAKAGEGKLKDEKSTDENDSKKANENKDDKVDGKKEADKDEKIKKDGEKTSTDKSTTKKSESENKTSSKSTSKDDKEKSTVEAKVTDNKSSASSSSGHTSHRNLWVSGLMSLTRASDLKTIFSKYGKVIGAKVVTNTRTPGSRCYGYVTMGSSAEATKCIDHIHGTELHGRIISVERTKNEIGSGRTSQRKDDVSKRSSKSKDRKHKTGETTSTKDDKSSTAEKDKEKEKNSDKTKDKDVTKSDKKPVTAPSDNESSKKTDGQEKTRSGEKGHSATRTSSVDRKKAIDRRIAAERERKERERREREILSFQKIREERERQRLREKERELREEERRRREIRRRQREEEDRLAREREKLAMERERLEREKAELMRLERERQKLEREKIELERLELKRQQMKIMVQNSRIEETKRPLKRSADDRYAEVERKRTASDRRFEAPPPPRFDTSLASGYERSSEKKRDEYVSSSKRDEYSSSKRDDYMSSKREDYSSKRDDYGKRSSDIVVPPSPPRHSSNFHATRETGATHKTHSQAARYIESEIRPTSYRNRRAADERTDIRSSGSKRYEVSSYSERPTSSVGAVSSSANPWHSSSGAGTAIKSFASSMPVSNSVSVWKNKAGEEHWGRPMESTQDRYDRTYNERSGAAYGIEASRAAPMFGRPDNRYGQISSRYENGKY